MDALPKVTSLNFNSLIGIIALGVIMWVGNTVSSLKESMTEVKTQLPYVNTSVSKLESQIALLVTRAEMEGRFAEMSAKMSVFDKRMMLLEFEKKKPNDQNAQ